MIIMWFIWVNSLLFISMTSTNTPVCLLPWALQPSRESRSSSPAIYGEAPGIKPDSTTQRLTGHAYSVVKTSKYWANIRPLKTFNAKETFLKLVFGLRNKKVQIWWQNHCIYMWLFQILSRLGSTKRLFQYGHWFKWNRKQMGLWKIHVFNYLVLWLMHDQLWINVNRCRNI